MPPQVTQLEELVSKRSELEARLEELREKVPVVKALEEQLAEAQELVSRRTYTRSGSTIPSSATLRNCLVLNVLLGGASFPIAYGSKERGLAQLTS